MTIAKGDTTYGQRYRTSCPAMAYSPSVAHSRLGTQTARPTTRTSSANTVDPARREIARIEQAILGMDDAEVERLGGFQICSSRIAELKSRIRYAGLGLRLLDMAFQPTSRGGRSGPAILARKASDAPDGCILPLRGKTERTGGQAVGSKVRSLVGAALAPFRYGLLAGSDPGRAVRALYKPNRPDAD